VGSITRMEPRVSPCAKISQADGLNSENVNSLIRRDRIADPQCIALGTRVHK
jgi:hypothetical protein